MAEKFTKKQMRALAGQVAYRISSLSAGWECCDIILGAMVPEQHDYFRDLVKSSMIRK